MAHNVLSTCWEVTRMSTDQVILVVDDDSAMREMLVELLRDESYEVCEAASVDDALQLAGEREFDAVLSDIKMPGRSGLELLGEMRELRPATPVVLMTAFGSIDAAVDAMRAGATDYLTKPFEPEAVLLTLERTLDRRALEVENRRLRRAVDQTSRLGDLIGTSPAMREIFALIRRVAHNRSSVLITGDSGTGKEVVARAIHYHGNRAGQPFVPVNCTAIPEGLLESELFGHVRGAFTGAHTSKRGLFEEATGGTIFLDEIGDMSILLQSKLLRVLQDREIRPVGGNKTITVDVRIIAATNQDLGEAMEKGTFREDLYYRMNVIPIWIPPLRERPEDIPALANAFAERHSEGEVRSLSATAMQYLVSREWKGNGRELENAIERAMALSAEEVLEAEDFPAEPGAKAASPAVANLMMRATAQRRLTLDEVQELYTEEVLSLTGGNKVQAAKILGVDRKTLYRRAERNARRAEQREAKEAAK
jgi:DNA-binding NtrC family response regulator